RHSLSAASVLTMNQGFIFTRGKRIIQHRGNPMPIDVIDLRSFYSSSLGEVARHVVHKIVRQRFSNCTGYSILGVGYATPYLEVFREEAVRVLAFMPAEQGVVNWPSSGLSSSALAEITAMPLPNSCIDRALIFHELKITVFHHSLLYEI